MKENNEFNQENYNVDNIVLINKLSYRIGKLEGALEWLILEVQHRDLDLEIDLDGYKKILLEEVDYEN
jgi:hypothetical protein